MFIQQISVFVPNQKGQLGELTNLLGEHGVDMIAVCVADTTNFGILRAIVSDNERAMDALRKAGYTANLTDVLAVSVPDVPGGLGAIAAVLSEAGVSIEYLYSFVRHAGSSAVIIIRVDDPARAVDALSAKQIALLSESELLKV